MCIFAAEDYYSTSMAPIPQKKKPQLQQQVRQQTVRTDSVYDSFGRPLALTLRKQKHTNRDHDERITTNRQHAQQYESDMQKDKLIYRDVFPGRKYKLTLSDTTWMGGDNVVTAGYTVGDTFTQIFSTAEAPEANTFGIDMPVVAAVDTLEIRLVGASDTVRGYIEDCTTSSSISGAVARLIDKVADLIAGQDNIEGDIRDIKQTLEDHEDRIEALENE